jgi:amino acid adenylation domain-containing protein
VEKVNVRRDASRNPIFDVMFRLHNFEAPGGGIQEMEIRGLKLSTYNFDPHTSIFDLNFGCGESGGKLLFTIDYCTALFKAETIERIIKYFRKIVEAVQEKESLAKKLADIEIISRQEKLQVLYDFNHTKTEYPKDKTIHDLFEEQVERTPDHVALVGVHKTHEKHEKNYNMSHLSYMSYMSYKELNEKSHRLAIKLKEKGIKSGTIAAIMVNRTIRMMAGLLGILKAGGAYLPLDPEYPEARINYILANSASKFLLTDKNHEGHKGIRWKGEKIFLEEQLSNCSLKPGTSNRQPAASLAYVIYTSGSTGNPKGVVIGHQNAVNFIKGMTSTIDFSPGKTILALTTISFDIFFLETLLPITCGLKVVIADETQQKDPQLLTGVIIGNKIDMLQFTPSRLKLLLNFQDDLQCLQGIKELIVGGEAFPGHLFEQVRERFRGKIYNVYGPTETTIWSTVKDLSGIRPDALTIGSPIANTQIYIVDKHNRIQPLGVPGQLVIGGDGVASGYLNNPELTGEKFIFNRHYRSYRSYRSYILYQTGDLARWLPGGEIEFLGRLDHQVKIRGFRIEPEEIEEQLMGHEGIKEAVVIAKTVKDGDNYLAAYFVPVFPGKEKEVDVSQLRDYLSRQLPHYMIPSYFISLEKVPLTPNGKINRSALPEPDQSRPQLSTTYTAPKTGEEKIVAQLWKEVLQVDNVGIYDNFFDLGGNSMKLIQLSNKLKEILEKDIPVITIFRFPTIESLLQYLGQAETQGSMTDEQIDRAMGDLEDTLGLLIGTDGE